MILHFPLHLPLLKVVKTIIQVKLEQKSCYHKSQHNHNRSDWDSCINSVCKLLNI